MAKVLQIGGSPEEQSRIAEVLSASGHEVHRAAGPPDGLAAALRLRPDVILIDLDARSYEAATRLRSFESLEGIGIITLSGNEDRELALSLGADGWLTRPVDPAALRRRIRSVLRGRRERVPAEVRRRHLEAYSRSLVTRLEHQVEELTVANERLRRADDLKNRIFDSVSRELATPLTPLLGYLELLESGRLGPLVPRQRRAVVGVQHAVRRLAFTVDRLIDLATLQDASTPVERAPMDVVEVAREARAALDGKARSRTTQLDAVLPRDPVVLHGDPDRLRQVFIHLLDNAIRFTPKGGAVLLAVRARGDRVQVSFYDSGEPIDPEARDRVFEPFARPGRRSASDAPPPDLELALSRRIAEAHGGHLTVESPPQEAPETDRHYTGARFVLDLPVG